ncbi:hypothetical protein NIES2130_35595 [Scytonema sp. HK-05]|nr:hypothetical protein NIES2130_35595 [Scytonema sp. HK-05]
MSAKVSLASTKATENTKAFTFIKLINIELQNDYCLCSSNAGLKYITFVWLLIKLYLFAY